MSLETISCDRTMVVPWEVALCPMCQADLYLSFDQWEINDDGTWVATQRGTRLDCSHEPDIDGDEWEDWHDWHYAMPHVDWLPVQHRVWRWVWSQYRFDVVSNEVTRLEQMAQLKRA